MSDRISPFAALTGAEKQIKWLEYQSVRLPYIQASMEQKPETLLEPQKNEAAQQQAEARETCAKTEPSQNPPARLVPPPEVFVSPQASANDFQRTRHSQYDAVIARMKQAELQARTYHAMS